MKRGLTGHYVPLPSAAGETARAFVPNPLPPLDDEEYILRLIGKVITVSLETMKTLSGLPAIAFEGQ